MTELPEGGTHPLVHAVLLNWHDNPRTRRCIDSLLAEPLIDRIHVVDNESDGSLAKAISEQLGPRLSLIAAPDNRGFAGGVNLGLRAALSSDAQQILCINNDALLLPGTVAIMSSMLEDNPSLGFLAPIAEDLDGHRVSAGGRFNRILVRARDDELNDPDYLTWACVLLSRELLSAIGLLDQAFFMYWEDVDFGLRARMAGFRPAVIAKAHIRHEISSSHGRAGSRIKAYSTAGLVTLARKHGWMLIPGAIYRTVGRFLKAVARCDLAGARAVARGAIIGLRIRDSDAYRHFKTARL